MAAGAVGHALIGAVGQVLTHVAGAEVEKGEPLLVGPFLEHGQAAPVVGGGLLLAGSLHEEVVVGDRVVP